MLNVAGGCAGLTAALIRRFATIFVETHSEADVAGRVAQVLLILADQHGQVTPQGLRTPLRGSQSTLGGLAGGSRENVNRALAQMAAKGLIAQDEGCAWQGSHHNPQARPIAAGPVNAQASRKDQPTVTSAFSESSNAIIARAIRTCPDRLWNPDCHSEASPPILCNLVSEYCEGDRLGDGRATPIGQARQRLETPP